MGQPIVQVDAFAMERFRGNPAAVCILDGPADDAWMAAVAREMNLSETAFLHPEDGAWRLRWLTPEVEVDLCGHATLASAHVLWEEGRVPAGRDIRFETRSGPLGARLAGAWIELDFPATPAQPAPAPSGLLEALGVREPVAVARSRFDWLVEVAGASLVRALSPDFDRLRAVEARGVIVTARSDEAGHDFVSRFFAPAAGVDEDPVTGSAHCTLAPWWAARMGTQRLTGYQASRRGGVVCVEFAGERVRIAGQAITVMRGELV